MSSIVVWKLPVPSTALEGGGPVFEHRPGRTCAIRYSYEAADDSVALECIVFLGVEAFKATHYHARDVSMSIAHDRLVDLGPTEWLAQVRSSLERHRDNSDGLVHLMIDFDDGPCFEFICISFRVEAQGQHEQVPR